MCVDGSSHAQAALDAFVELPWSSGAEAVVLGVWDPWSDIDRGERGAHKVLTDAAIDARPVRARGKATTAILEQIELVQPDLVVLGRKAVTP